MSGGSSFCSSCPFGPAADTDGPCLSPAPATPKLPLSPLSKAAVSVRCPVTLARERGPESRKAMNPITSAAPFHGTPAPTNPLLSLGPPSTACTGLQTPTRAESKLCTEGEVRAQQSSPRPLRTSPLQTAASWATSSGPSWSEDPQAPPQSRDTLLTPAWPSLQFLSGTPVHPSFLLVSARPHGSWAPPHAQACRAVWT